MVSRTQARQLVRPWDAPRVLADIACQACGKVGVTIIGLGVNDSGAVERVFCGHDCAKLHGWPWIRDIEKRRGRRCVTA